MTELTEFTGILRIELEVTLPASSKKEGLFVTLYAKSTDKMPR
jgi:hypothetical protein